MCKFTSCKIPPAYVIHNNTFATGHEKIPWKFGAVTAIILKVVTVSTVFIVTIAAINA